LHFLSFIALRRLSSLWFKRNRCVPPSMLGIPFSPPFVVVSLFIQFSWVSGEFPVMQAARYPFLSLFTSPVFPSLYPTLWILCASSHLILGVNRDPQTITNLEGGPLAVLCGAPLPSRVLFAFLPAPARLFLVVESSYLFPFTALLVFAFSTFPLGTFSLCLSRPLLPLLSTLAWVQSSFQPIRSLNFFP